MSRSHRLYSIVVLVLLAGIAYLHGDRASGHRPTWVWLDDGHGAFQLSAPNSVFRVVHVYTLIKEVARSSGSQLCLSTAYYVESAG